VWCSVKKHSDNFTFTFFGGETEIRRAYNILVGKPERKRPLGRRKSRREGNIRMDLGKCGGKVWTGFIWLWIGTSGESL
jgi:hypothetical protein